MWLLGLKGLVVKGNPKCTLSFKKKKESDQQHIWLIVFWNKNMQKFCYKPLLLWCLNQNKWFNILEFIPFSATLEYCQPNMLYS